MENPEASESPFRMLEGWYLAGNYDENESAYLFLNGDLRKAVLKEFEDGSPRGFEIGLAIKYFEDEANFFRRTALEQLKKGSLEASARFVRKGFESLTYLQLIKEHPEHLGEVYPAQTYMLNQIAGRIYQEFISSQERFESPPDSQLEALVGKGLSN